MAKEIVRGSIVRYRDGWARVSKKTAAWVNLRPVFSTLTMVAQRVPLDEVYEDRDAWYENWRESETYKSM
jgi:hypothetical protein